MMKVLEQKLVIEDNRVFLDGVEIRSVEKVVIEPNVTTVHVVVATDRVSVKRQAETKIVERDGG